MKKIFRHKILVFGVLLVFIITIMMPTINGNLCQIKDIQKNFNKKESNLETIGGSDYWLQTTDEDFNSGTKTNIVVQNDEFFLDKTFREFTLIDNESFENEWPPNNWVENGYWNKESDQVHTGSYSADIDGWLFPAGGNLITYSMDCALENIIEIYVSFWGYDEGSDLGEYYLDYYDGNEWD